MRPENKELMFCYYTSHPNIHGFCKRLYELWHKRNTDSIYSSFSEQKLCGQVRSLQKHDYFTSVELDRLELCKLGTLEVYQIVLSEYQSTLFAKVMSCMEALESQMKRVYL